MANPIRGFMDMAQRATEAARRMMETTRTQAKGGSSQEASAAGGAQKPASSALFSDGFFAQQEVKVDLSGGMNSLARPQSPVEAQQDVSQLTPEEQVRASQEAVEVDSLALDEAREARVDADAELAQQLAELEAAGLPLAPEQQAAYVAAYRQEHQGVYDAETQAAERLSTSLQSLVESTQALEAQGGFTAFGPAGGDVATWIHRATEQLADTPYAQTSVEVISDLLLNPDSSLYQYYNSGGPPNLLTRMAEETLGVAISNSMGALTLEHGAQEGAARLSELLAPLERVEGFPELTALVTGARPLLESAARGEPAGLSSEAWSALPASGRLKEGLQAAAAGLSLVQGAEAGLTEEQMALRIQSIAGMSGMGVRGVGMIANALANGSKLAGAAGNLAQFGGPMLAAVGGLAGLYHDGSQFLNDPTGAEALALAGSTASLAGTVLGAAGVLTGGGAIAVAAVGFIFTQVGRRLAALDDQADRNAEQQKLLEQVLKDPGLATLYAYSDGEDTLVEHLAQTGWSQAQLSELASRMEDLTRPEFSLPLIIRMQQGLGSPEDVLALLGHVEQRLGAEHVHGLLRVLGSQNMDFPNPEAMVAYLQNRLSWYQGDGNTVNVEAIQAAIEFLESRSQ